MTKLEAWKKATELLTKATQEGVITTAVSTNDVLDVAAWVLYTE